jgi:hypothetical protein
MGYKKKKKKLYLRFNHLLRGTAGHQQKRNLARNQMGKDEHYVEKRPQIGSTCTKLHPCSQYIGQPAEQNFPWNEGGCVGAERDAPRSSFMPQQTTWQLLCDSLCLWDGYISDPVTCPQKPKPIKNAGNGWLLLKLPTMPLVLYAARTS